MVSLKECLDRFLSGGFCRKVGAPIIILFFIGVVFIPTVWVFSYAFTSWDQVYNVVILNPSTYNMMVRALMLSLQVAFIATTAAVLLGMPIAWVLVKRRFRGREIVNALVDIPIIVPTSVLGFSIYLFWGTRMGLGSLMGLEEGILSPGPMLIISLHIAFCLPYVVRSVIGMIEGIDVTYEHAARTLGAPPLTTFRTVSLPLITPGVVSGAILSFTRSLSETGATMIVAGAYETAPVLIASWRKTIVPAAAFLSMILVAVAWILIMLTSLLAERFRTPMMKAWPCLERRLSGLYACRLRDAAILLAFIFFILIPSSFVIAFTIGKAPIASSLKASEAIWPQFWTSLSISFLIAAASTLVSLVMGVPLAIIIVRRLRGRMKVLLDALVNTSVMVPTSALAFSLWLFWGPCGLGFFDFGLWLVFIVHVTFNYPYIVRPIVASLEGLDPMFEEAGRTLGAKPFTVFYTITYPMTRSSLLASIVLSFTRSLSETGATMVASAGALTTAPVLIVDWVLYALKTWDIATIYVIALMCTALVFTSGAILMIFRYLMKRLR